MIYYTHIRYGLSDLKLDSNQLTRIRLDQDTEPWAISKLTRQVQVQLKYCFDIKIWIQSPTENPFMVIINFVAFCCGYRFIRLIKLIFDIIYHIYIYIYYGSRAPPRTRTWPCWYSWSCGPSSCWTTRLCYQECRSGRDALYLIMVVIVNSNNVQPCKTDFRRI